MEFRHTQLDNGLTIIAEIMESAKSMALGFFVRTGSRDETPELSGVSHFLEHMMFKGTTKRSAMDVNLEFDEMGAKYNAFTSEENTVYYAAVLPEYQQRVLDLWSDLMRPALRDDDFNTEKGVICEEIAMYKDLPHFDVMDKCRKLHYDTHGCGNSVLGTVESIQAMTAAGMRGYFEKRYAPDNMVLACAGKVDWDQLVAQATEACKKWEASNPERQLSEAKGTGLVGSDVQEKIIRQHLCMMTAAPAAQNEKRYAASLLANIIGDDTGSRMYWDLIDTAMADCAEMEYDSADGTGAFYTYISCDPGQTDNVISIVKNCLDKIRKEGVTAEELQASKNKLASSMTLNGELPMGRLIPLGFNWIYRKEYKSMAEELEMLQSVTLDDIKDVIKDYPLEPLTIQGLGPNKL